MSMLAVWPLLMLIPGVLFLLLAVGAITRAVAVPAVVKRRPACGGCGHECAEPLTDRCPECGGRYVRVGMVTPSLAVRLRGGLTSALIAWTALSGVAATVLFTVAQQAAWSTASSGFGTTVTTRTMEPVKASGGLGRVDSSKLDYRVEVVTTSAQGGSATPADSVRFEIRKNGTRNGAVLEIDGADGSFTIKSLDGKSLGTGTTFTSTDADTMFKAADLDITYPAVRASVTSFTSTVQRAAQDPGTLERQSTNWEDQASVGELRFGGSSSSTSGGGMTGPPSMWTMGWVRIGSVAGVVVYVVGLALITARYRRLVSRSAA